VTLIHGEDDEDDDGLVVIPEWPLGTDLKLISNDWKQFFVHKLFVSLSASRNGPSVLDQLFFRYFT